MQFFKQGIYIDFMRLRRTNLLLSLALFLVSIVIMIVPGPKLGIDFAGGTEIQLAFDGPVSASELRSALSSLGYTNPDVVSVEGQKHEYILRIQDVSAVPKAEVRKIRIKLESALHARGSIKMEEFRVSPGGDKISLRFSDAVDVQLLESALSEAGTKVRAISPFGQQKDHKYEAQLVGVADQVLRGLSQRLGSRAPSQPRRVEWVGPKAGEQLRDAALKSLLYAIAFIMVYVAFRFDLRFAPGGVIAMVHDAVITAGIFVLLRKEVNLTFVAAILTIVGYSINDTIVVYDRIRENLARKRGTSLREIVNLSTSETLSRTLITGGTTLLSLLVLYLGNSGDS
jgi:preprotein translocase subunit SecF